MIFNECKKNKGNTTISVLFLILGIAGLVASVFYKINTDKFLADVKKVQAEITQISEDRRKGDINDRDDKGIYYAAYVSYTVDGKYYENVKLDYYITDMKVGQRIEVLYLEENPGDIRTNFGSTASVYIGFVVSVIFIIIGICLIICKRRQVVKKNCQFV